MPSSFGVGYSEDSDSRSAGLEAASAALQAAGGGAPVLVLLFSTSRHDPHALGQAVREVAGPQARLAGGYSVGIVTQDRLAYDGYQVGVAMLVSDEIDVQLFAESGLADGEEDVGLRLGHRLAQAQLADSAAVLLLYDSVNRSSGRFELNMATPLLRGLRLAMPTLPPTVGAGLVGDMQCRATHQWVDERIEEQTALALVLSGAVRMDTVVMHGCRPASRYHTVTRVDGATVLEIDGRPALDTIADLLGSESEISWRDYSFFVTLGVNTGDEFSFDEDRYINRLCLRVDAERRGLVMFEPDLVPGCRVQLMRRSVDMAYVRTRTEALLARLEGRKPLFALYIDCAGRAGTYAGTEEEEAAQLQAALAGRMPLLGIYSGVELGPVGGRTMPLDWSGVLCIFSA
jgi:small ligand-binding sensory domain FIST